MHTPLVSVSLIFQALRRLSRERGFTATVLLTLALCIGANLTIFAVVDAILVRSLPFPEADRLVTAINAYPGAGVERAGASMPNYFDRRGGGIAAFKSVSIFQNNSYIIGDAGTPNRVQGARVSPEFFATLGVPLAMGQTFTDAELAYQTDQVAVLTDGFWRSHFNADPAVLGRTFQSDGLSVTVAGVLPRNFRFLSSRAQLFRPSSHELRDREPDRRHSNNFQLIARLAPGATLAEAQAQIDALNARQIADDPYAALLQSANFHTMVHPLHEDHVREVRPILILLQGFVLFLLLIGGVNLVNLLLVRASGRAKELAVRQALGASRRHVAREVLVETLLLSTVGGVLGLGLGALGVRLLAILGTDQLPLGATVALDVRLAALSFLASLMVGVALAVPVVWFNVRGHRLANALQTETRGGTVSRAAQRVRHGFIVVQVALAFVLLTGAGMLGISLKRVMATTTGFRAEQVLTGQINLPWKTYPAPEPRLAFIDRLLGELRNKPGVTSVGITSGLPFSGSSSNNATAVEGVTLAPGESIRSHYTSTAVGEYWQALGIPLIEGRLFEDADNHRDHKVCVVDEAFARRYWPTGSALGHRIASNPVFTEENAHTIVGVVGTVKQNGLTETEELGTTYYPYKQLSSTGISVVIRSPMSPDAISSMLRQTVLALDPELPVDDVKTMETRIEDSLISRRSPALLAAIFAGVALLLAAIGAYGVLAYAVNQRRREIGVRMALGALPRQVLGQFLSLGLKLFLAGTTFGVILAWALGRSMKSMLFGVEGLHFGVLGATAGIMMVVVLLATLLPSQRAARVSPLEALRED